MERMFYPQFRRVARLTRLVNAFVRRAWLAVDLPATTRRGERVQVPIAKRRHPESVDGGGYSRSASSF